MKLKDLLSIPVGSIKSVFKAMMIKVTLWLLAIIVLIVVGVKSVDYLSERYACHTQWVESSIEYKYTLRGGCLLKLDGGWLPAKNYRVN